MNAPVRIFPTDALDYCNAAVEIAENPLMKAHLTEIARGNEDAFRFMWVYWNFQNVYDDLVDKDKPVSVEQAAKWVVHWMEQLSFNPFYLAHRHSILPHIVDVCNRWCDAEAWEKNRPIEEAKLASVIKCGDIDLFLHIAYLVGGWDHMRRMQHTRSYDPIDRKA